MVWSDLPLLREREKKKAKPDVTKYNELDTGIMTMSWISWQPAIKPTLNNCFPNRLFYWQVYNVGVGWVVAARPLWILSFVLLLSYEFLPTQRSLMNINQEACYWSLLQMCTGKCIHHRKFIWQNCITPIPIELTEFHLWNFAKPQKMWPHCNVYNQMKSWC